MVTTRTATGSLPAKKERVIETAKTNTRKSRQGQQVDKSHDTKAVIGDGDRFSRLPMDILVDIFSRCHYKSLLHLARTNRTIRAYLTSKRSQPVWQTAREALSYWIDHGGKIRLGKRPSPSRNTGAVVLQDDRSTANIAVVDDNDNDEDHGLDRSLPDPAPFWSELQMAEAVFPQCSLRGTDWLKSQCFSCHEPVDSSYYPHFSLVYCIYCDDPRLVTFSEIQRLWEEEQDLIDNRFWTILPEQGGRRPSRSTLRCIDLSSCERLKEEYFRIAYSATSSPNTVNAWFDDRVARERARENCVWQMKVWQGGYEAVIRAQIHAIERINRKSFERLALDNGYSISDIRNARDEIAVKSRNLTFAKVRKHFEKARHRLDPYKEKRLLDEDYDAHAGKRKRVLDHLLASENKADLEAKFGKLENRMVDICQLPSVMVFMDEVTDKTASDVAKTVWTEKWPQICTEMDNLVRTWQLQLLRAMYGSKARFRGSDYSVFANFSTIFTCKSCRATLQYPTVLDHSCFCEVSRQSTYTSLDPEVCATSNGTRPRSLTLESVTNNKTYSDKFSILCTAMEAAGQPSPTIVSKSPFLADVCGHFLCGQCGERFDWYDAAIHVNSFWYEPYNNDNADAKRRRKKHNKMTFVPNDAPANSGSEGFPSH